MSGSEDRSPNRRHALGSKIYKKTFWQRTLIQRMIGVLALGALASFAGCGERETATIQLPTRAFSEDPTTFFDPVQSLPWEREVVARWSFAEAEESRWWHILGEATSSELLDSGLHLQSSKLWIGLERRVQFQADGISMLEVKMSGGDLGHLVFSWAPEGALIDSAREIKHSITAAEEQQGLVRVLLDQHPLWNGPIARLRLSFIQRPGKPLQLQTLALMRLRLTGDGGNWTPELHKVDIQQEVRSAILAHPGKPLEIAAEPGPGSVLRFGYGVWGSPGAGTLRVDWEDGTGQHSLLEDALSDAERRWHDVEVDLDAVAGRRGKLRLSVSLEQELDPFQGAYFLAQPEIVPPPSESRPLNVVLISIDTLRPDHLSLYGYGRPTSPRLDALAAERGVVFEQVVASSSTTKISHTSMFSGLDAHRHGVQHGKVSPDLELLPEIMHRQGFLTWAITGGGRVHPRYGFAQGFDRYIYDKSGDDLEANIEHALAFLDLAKERPFFLFFHTYEVHAPYRAREPYYHRFSTFPFEGQMTVNMRGRGPGQPTEWDWIMQDPSGKAIEDWPRERAQSLAVDYYDSSIAFMDEKLGRLLDRLEELNLMDRTLLIITSDHGEAFGEGGRITHGFLDDSNLLVPLIIAAPGAKAAPGSRIAQQVRSVDLLPTILELAGLPVPAGLDGVSLRPYLEGSAASTPAEAWSYISSTNYGLSLRLGGRLKYIFNNSIYPTPDSREVLFDLRRDAVEVENLAESMETSTLRQRAIAELSEKTPGLLVRLRNGAEKPLRFTLSNAVLVASRIDTWDLPVDRVTECCSGRVQIDLERGDDYHLLIDATRAQRFAVELDDGESTFQQADLQFESDTPWRVAQTGSGFLVDPDGSTPDVGVEILWRGRSADIAEPTVDEELRRQLEALGYVD